MASKPPKVYTIDEALTKLRSAKKRYQPLNHWELTATFSTLIRYMEKLRRQAARQTEEAENASK